MKNFYLVTIVISIVSFLAWAFFLFMTPALPVWLSALRAIIGLGLGWMCGFNFAVAVDKLKDQWLMQKLLKQHGKDMSVKLSKDEKKVS